MEQELIPTKEPNSYRKKEKAGSIRGGTGSGGQSSQQTNAMKNRFLFNKFFREFYAAANQISIIRSLSGVPRPRNSEPPMPTARIVFAILAWVSKILATT